jgi:CARDB
MQILFQYAAKVVVGRSEGEVAAAGEYWTAVNVHNPNSREARVRAKVAVGLPGCQPGPIAELCRSTLKPDQALEIDRKDVQRAVDADFVKGFVVVESPVELDVVAVYTAAAEDRVVTLHVERVPARRLEIGLPDLIPVPDENGSFCRLDEKGNLIVTVRNQGTAGAGPSVTRVDFGSLGSFTAPTPPLSPGAAVDVTVPVPGGCFSPDCGFQIVVDANNDVIESDEGNNIAHGICIG